MTEPWRGIESERYHLLVKIRKDPHALVEHMDFVADFARRAVAQGVRMSAQQLALGLPPGREAMALVILVDAIESGEVDA